MQKKHGFAPLGPADGPVKRAIFGETSARLYGYGAPGGPVEGPHRAEPGRVRARWARADEPSLRLRGQERGRARHEDPHRRRLGGGVERHASRGVRARRRGVRGRPRRPRGGSLRGRRRRAGVGEGQARVAGLHQYPRAHHGQWRRLDARRHGQERPPHVQLSGVRRAAQGQAHPAAAGGRGGAARLRVPPRAQERLHHHHRRGRPARGLGGLCPPGRRPRRARLREPALSRPQHVHRRAGTPLLRHRRRRGGQAARRGDRIRQDL